jgi:hypothetical protein
MYKPKQTITPQDLEEKQLKLKEKYNFKLEEKHNCYSFKIKDKIAFIINLSEPSNYKKIVPYLHRRNDLAKIVDEIYDAENKIEIKSGNFLKTAIEIISNMLDITKMGSIDVFINFLINIIKNKSLTDSIELFGSIIAMIDISVDNQLGELNKEQINNINNEFINDVLENAEVYMFDGKKFKKISMNKEEKDNPDPYNLKNMTPLNKKVI